MFSDAFALFYVYVCFASTCNVNDKRDKKQTKNKYIQ